MTRTLSARYYKGGSEILLSQGVRQRPRRLTPRECARLMGFVDDFVIPVSDSRAYQLIAKSPVVPMVEAVAKCVVSKLTPAEPIMDKIDISDGAFPRKGDWTSEQLKLAFAYYCQTPFGRLHSKNRDIIELAGLLGRTPGALAMKLVNFASLDPSITNTGRKGLSGASARDREIWNEFHADWERLALEAEQLRLQLLRERGIEVEDKRDIADEFTLIDYTGETRQAIVQQRIKQSFFRRAVLASYGGRCCISEVSDSRLLVASHIVPWREDKANRLNPSNGLCLSAIHDKAFDSGLIALSDDFRVLVSTELLDRNDAFVDRVFAPIIGQRIEIPERFVPDKELIRRHRLSHFKAG